MWPSSALQCGCSNAGQSERIGVLYKLALVHLQKLMLRKPRNLYFFLSHATHILSIPILLTIKLKPEGGLPASFSFQHGSPYWNRQNRLKSFIYKYLVLYYPQIYILQIKIAKVLRNSQMSNTKIPFKFCWHLICVWILEYLWKLWSLNVKFQKCWAKLYAPKLLGTFEWIYGSRSVILPIFGYFTFEPKIFKNA